MREEGSTLLEKYFINIERGDTAVAGSRLAPPSTEGTTSTVPEGPPEGPHLPAPQPPEDVSESDDDICIIIIINKSTYPTHHPFPCGYHSTSTSRLLDSSLSVLKTRSITLVTFFLRMHASSSFFLANNNFISLLQLPLLRAFVRESDCVCIL